MNSRTFLQIQAVQLRQLLAQVGDDPILAPQLHERLEEMEKRLATTKLSGELFAPEASTVPRVALFLRGGGVQGDEGIRPALAGEALIQYEKMYTEQALNDERVIARSAGRTRRRRGSEKPFLFFTGTPRGSFGLEFVPQPTEDQVTLKVHSQSLCNLAEAIVRVSADESSSDRAIDEISPAVLRPMKRFLKTLASYGAELRLAFSNAPSKSISAEQIDQAAKRLEREIEEEESTAHGIFRGLTRETTVFDFIADGVGLIDGMMSADLTEEDFDRISELTDKRSIAEVQKTIVRHVDGSERVTYVLINAWPESSGQTNPTPVPT